jgi:peptidoglycan hydrolase-like protein with peptidoglycan-binding domain
MTIGDGHDLKSSRFSGDEVLEACYDKERVLRRGDSGSAIKKVQEALIILGIPVPEVGANGIFGDETELAVRSYQEARGLKVDGVIGSDTIESLDAEFPGVTTETPVLPTTEPQVSEVPTPLTPESPVRSPRASPVEPVRAPPVPSVEAPEAPVPPAQAAPVVEHVRAPLVEPVRAPPVPPVPEVSARPERATRPVGTPVGTKPPSTAPLVPPVTSSPPQADSQGRKFHSSGMWNADSFLEIQGGRSMHFEVKNLHALASTLRIKANNGESRDSVILSQTTADFEFSMVGKEPFDWKFDIETDSDTALLEWYLYSTWVPGDPDNF